MAKRTQTETDGITTTTRETFDGLHDRMSKADAQALVAAVKRSQANPSFEVKIREIEPELQELRDGGSDAPRYGSRAYYAREMLDTITRVRRLRNMYSPAGVDAALAAAMRVGWLAAEWTAKGWPDLQLGQAHRAHQKARARQGVRAKRENRAPGDRTLLEAVRVYRAKHPTAKSRAVARGLVVDYGRPYQGPLERSKAIDALRQRIARLEKM
jgi:hypothetical protein